MEYCFNRIPWEDPCIDRSSRVLALTGLTGFLLQAFVSYNIIYNLFTDFQGVIYYLGFLVCAFLAAFLFHLGIEAPLMGLEKLVMG